MLTVVWVSVCLCACISRSRRGSRVLNRCGGATCRNAAEHALIRRCAAHDPVANEIQETQEARVIMAQ